MAISFAIPDDQEKAARWLLNAALHQERENWRGYTFFAGPIGDERRAEQAELLALLETLITQNFEVYWGLECGWLTEVKEAKS